MVQGKSAASSSNRQLLPNNNHGKGRGKAKLQCVHYGSRVRVAAGSDGVATGRFRHCQCAGIQGRTEYDLRWRPQCQVHGETQGQFEGLPAQGVALAKRRCQWRVGGVPGHGPTPVLARGTIRLFACLLRVATKEVILSEKVTNFFDKESLVSPKVSLCVPSYSRRSIVSMTSL